MRAPTTFPACFPGLDAFAAWLRAARRVHNGTTSPCEDCTDEYREGMEREGRCDPQAVRERFKVGA
jgi:hypothetical protein